MIGPGVGVPLGHQLSPYLHPSLSPLPQGMAQVPTHLLQADEPSPVPSLLASRLDTPNDFLDL